MKQPNNKKNSKAGHLKYLLVGVAVLIVAVFAYVLVIHPSSPDYVLRAAVENTFNTDKNKSGRYDGTYNETNSGLSVEFSGSSTGEQSISKTRVSIDGQKVDFQVYNDSIVNFSGAGQYKYILGKMSDNKITVDPNIDSIITQLDSKWIDVSSGNLGKVTRQALCLTSNKDFNFSTMQVKEMLKNSSYQIVSGPYSDTGDAGSSVFDIKITNAELLARLPFIQPLVSQSECLSGLRKQDYKTRAVSAKDVESAIIKVYINTSNNTITRISAKQVGVFFTLNIHDLNKDVVVARPDNVMTIDAFAQSLSAEQQAALLDVFVSKPQQVETKQ